MKVTAELIHHTYCTAQLCRHQPVSGHATKKSEKGGEKGEINGEEREPYRMQHRFFRFGFISKQKIVRYERKRTKNWDNYLWLVVSLCQIC